MLRRFIKTGVVLAALGILWMAAASRLVISSARGKTYSDSAAIPARHVGLVLGCIAFRRRPG